MTTPNINELIVETSYIVNPAKSELKVVVTSKKENKSAKHAKAVPSFAKNTRYSIYNNGGGYTGL